MSRMPEDDFTSTVDAAAAYERHRGESDDDVDDRYLDAAEDLERDAVRYCETCDQMVTGPCGPDCELEG